MTSIETRNVRFFTFVLSVKFIKSVVSLSYESIKRMRNHLERNSFPKPLKYSARGNIPADKQFKMTLRPSNRNPSAAFVEALTKFQEMSMAKRKGRTDSKNV